MGVEELETQNLSFVDNKDEDFLKKYSLESLNALKSRIQTVSENAYRVQDEIIRRLTENVAALETQLSNTRDDKLCCICFAKEKDVLFLPCKHICICAQCRLKLDPYRCPMCKQDIRSYLHRIHF